MCGRTVCLLEPEDIRSACSYRDPNLGKYVKPNWREHPQNENIDEPSYKTCKYYPSVNISPTKFTPILFREKHTSSENPHDNLFIQPMMWGLIPPWHKEGSHGLSTNNCRLEGLPSSKLYNKAFTSRNFCVVLAQGFYEWQSTTVEKTFLKPKHVIKQPYLIYMKEDTNIEKKINETCSWSEENGWSGPKLLKMAGLYDIWTSPDGNVTYSYTVITMDSNSTLSWLHERMPAILESQEEVDAWLDGSGSKQIYDTLKILKPATNLLWYPVSSKVNKSTCFDDDCISPIVIEKTEKKKTFMDNWLVKKNERKESINETEKQDKITTFIGENESKTNLKSGSSSVSQEEKDTEEIVSISKKAKLDLRHD